MENNISVQYMDDGDDDGDHDANDDDDDDDDDKARWVKYCYKHYLLLYQCSLMFVGWVCFSITKKHTQNPAAPRAVEMAPTKPCS